MIKLKQHKKNGKHGIYFLEFFLIRGFRLGINFCF